MRPRGALTRLWLARAVWGCALGAAIALLEFAYYAPLVSTPSARSMESLVSSLSLWCGESTLFMLILTAAERWRQPGELRGWSLALAVACGVLVAVPVWHAFTDLVLHDAFGMRPFRDHVGQPGVWIGAVLYHTWLLLVFGGLGCATYVSQRRYTRIVAALRAAELDRAASQRRLAETSLAALQARIDPDFVMNTLTRLEHLYDGDPQSADRVLDELIIFLRRALVDLRASDVFIAAAHHEA